MLWILNTSFNLSINVLYDFMMRSFTDSELIIPVFYTSMVITDDKITFSLFVHIMSPSERPNKVRITSSMYSTSTHFNILFGTRIFNYISATTPRKTYTKLNWNADERENSKKINDERATGGVGKKLRNVYHPRRVIERYTCFATIYGDRRRTVYLLGRVVRTTHAQ